VMICNAETSRGTKFHCKLCPTAKSFTFSGLIKKGLRKETELQVNTESFEIFTDVWLRIPFVWDMTQYPFVRRSR